MGILMFILLNVIVIVNKKLFKSLSTIDKNVSSYQYLKSFDTWMKEQIAVNVKNVSIHLSIYFLLLWYQDFGFLAHFKNL